MPDQPSPVQVMPALYVVATPLGNLGDLTERARHILSAVEVIAAEDTRHSQRLLDALRIRGPKLVALHEHNEHTAAGQVIERLASGGAVALITDAGTPAISDPGSRAVRRVREAGYPVIPVPGACAAIAALSVAGLDGPGFRFVGFLASRQAARLSELEALRDEPMPVVVYESPHRIAACLDDMLSVFGPEREVVIAREITKLHEQIVRLPLAEVPAWLASNSNHQRGEFVVVVDGAPAQEGLSADAERVLGLLLAELPVKTAARLAAEITGASRNALYAYALSLKKRED